MINRRHQIKSALAERKMFANGGMVSPNMPQGGMMPPSGRVPAGILASSQPMVNAATPMGMQNAPAPLPTPQGMPNVPAGILALSPDTIDAATQDFLSAAGLPAGNPGPMPMAQGGLVESENMMAQGYADGGSMGWAKVTPKGRFPGPPKSYAVPPMISNVPSINGGGAYIPDVYLDKPTRFELDQYRTLYGKADLARRQALDANRRPSNPLLFDERVEAAAARRDELTLTREQAEAARLNRAKERQRAGAESERINNLLKIKSLDAYLEDLGASDKARYWFSNPANVKMVSSAGRTIDFPVDPNRAPNRIRSEADEQDLEEEDAYAQAQAATEGPAVATAEGPAVATADGAQTRIPLLEKGDDPEDSRRYELADGTPTTAGKSLEEAAATETPAAKPPTTKPPTTPGKSPTAPGNTDSSGHADQRKETSETAAKDLGSNPFSLESAVKEFTEAMPEYERSEESAGYNLIMLGAAIAAGQSPNAMTNIARGIQKALPAMIKDQKEAESYLRSVKMAGTKYALSKRDKLEAEKRSAERSKNTYYLDKDITVTQPDGSQVTYQQGWNRFNDRTVNEIGTIERQALVPLSAWNSANKVAAAAAKAKGSGYEKSRKVTARLSRDYVVSLQVQFPTAAGRAAGARPILLNPSALTNSYFEAVGTNDSLLSLANNSAELISKHDQKVTGFNQIAGKLYDVQRAWLGDKAPNLLRTAAVSIDQDGSVPYAKTKEEYERLTASAKSGNKKALLSDQARYNTQLRFLAIQMAPLLLGESGKTISDGDRRLIATALGMAEMGDKGSFRWIETASMSRGLLLHRLNQIREVLSRSRGDLDKNFASIVNDYGGTMPTQPALTRGSQRSRATTLSPFILRKTDELDDNKRPIYDLTRRRA